MLERLAAFAITQRLFILIAATGLAIAGVRTFFNLPIEAFPDVQDIQVQVITQAPGLAPEEVERAITLPIEREMGGVPHLTQVRSVSMTGLSQVTITFADRTDDFFARQQVLEKLQTVSLPPGAQPTLAPLTTAVGEVFRYVVVAPPEMPPYEVRALQDWVIRPALRAVPAVAEVVSFGGSVKEYQVRLDPARLRRYGITIDQVTQALSQASSNAGAGRLRRGDESLVVRGIGLYRDLADIGRVVVASRNGSPILVSDLGVVDIGERPLSGIVAFNDADTIVEGIVQMIKGNNAARVVEAVKARIAELQPRLPQGVAIEPIYDRTKLVDHTVETVGENLLVGALLVIGILILFLRNWRAALAVAAIIPLSLVFAFLAMDVRGMSANLISLGSVDFGVIIDSAVVLVEALMVRLATAHHGAPASTMGERIHALRNVATELGRPILFSKAILILAFLPIFTFQRVEGKIFSPMAFTLAAALFGAVVLTLTLLPTLLGWILEKHTVEEKHIGWMDALQRRYRGMIEALAPRTGLVTLASTGLLGAAVLSATMMGTEFLPKLDEGNIWLTIALPQSSSLEHSKDIERAVRAALRTYPEVGNLITQVGRPDDGTDPKGPNNIEVLAELEPRGAWRFASKERLIADMEKTLHQIPGLPTNFSQVIQDNVEESLSGVKGEIAVKVFGPDLGVLEEKAAHIARIIRTIRGATDVAAIPIGGQTELDITLDRARMARLGINVGDVNPTIQTALGGGAVGAFFEGDRRFDVTLRLAASFRSGVDEVAALPIAIPGTTNTVPLASIADIEVRHGASRVGREGGGRIAAVKANLLGRDQGSFVAEGMQRVAKEVALPPGYRVTWGGQFENQQRAMRRLAVIVPLSLALIFGLLFWAFRSVVLAGLVLAMVPFILLGGLAGLAISGLHLSVSAAVGFIALAGITVQNGVIMVEQILLLIEHGMAAGAAVVEGAVGRLRPIMMTALMAGLGLLPAALSQGIGSETQRPFAVVIVGGIVSGTVFMLVLLPLLLQPALRARNGDGQDA